MKQGVKRTKRLHEWKGRTFSEIVDGSPFRSSHGRMLGLDCCLVAKLKDMMQQISAGDGGSEDGTPDEGQIGVRGEDELPMLDFTTSTSTGCDQ